MSKISISFLVMLMLSLNANALTSLDWEHDKTAVVDIYAASKLPAGATAPMRMKWDEIHANWPQCRNEAATLLSQNSNFKGWVLVAHMKCARKELENSKSKRFVSTTLDQSFRARNVTPAGVWLNSYKQEFNRFLVSAHRLTKLTDAEVDKFLRQETDLTDENIKMIWSEIYPQSRKVKKDPDLSGAQALKTKDMKDLFAAWADLAKTSHKKLEFEDSLRSAVEALKFNKQDVQMLWVAGRSALFLGRYEEAKKYFTDLVELNSNTPEGDEGLFRLGLLQYRLGNYQLAVPAFEMIIQKNSDRYELNSWYWLYQSLVAMKSPKAESVKYQIINKYPYSYYGLKLLPSLKNLSRDPVTPENKVVKLYGDEAQTYSRIKTLLKNGWLIEAQIEANDLPVIPEPGWGLWLAQHRLWPAAIRVANRVIDDELIPRSWYYMQKFYPTDYADQIRIVAKSYGLDPILVQSLVRQESAYGIKAFSSSQAMGLMQMIPATAADLARRLKLKIDLEEEVFMPPNNLPMGTSYIASLVEEFNGHIPLALASYNAGPHKIKAWLALRPEVVNLKDVKSTDIKDELWIDELPFYETSFYVKAILRNIILYRLKYDPNYELAPNFWLDLWQKNGQG